MEKFKFLKKYKISKLPKISGVYAFKKDGKFLYIGKATDIKKRVKNHFSRPGFRGSLFINEAEKIGYLRTNSEIEALILEANLIKKHQPKYNVLWKDDKNYFFVAITKENFPRIFVTHQIKLKLKIRSWKSRIEFIGPFVEGSALKKTLKILRKIFPYYTLKKHPKNLCLWCQLNLCPGPNPNFQEYKKNINSLIAVLKGKKQAVLKGLKKEMKRTSALEKFERAAKIRDQIRILERIFAPAKIFEEESIPLNLKKYWSKTEKILKNLFKTNKRIFRIEAYDVSNIQGKEATGSMVVFIKGLPNKNFYRKFKIKTIDKPNDIAMIKEIIKRRLKHSEWPFADLILIDGGKAQFNAARSVINDQGITIPVIALAKRNNKLYLENRKNPILLENLQREIFNLILRIRDEAHRFAISYHRKLRR